MVEEVRRQAESAVSERRLTNEQMRTLMDHYEASLRSYTYLTED
jgi:arginine decarboxylase